MYSKANKLFVVFFIFCSLTTFVLNAQTVVVDKDDNFPVAFASVFNQDGKFIGQTDVEGRLPDLKEAKTIRVTHIAYEPLKAKVSSMGQELKLKPVQMQLGEAVVTTPKTHCIRLTGFLRNYAFSNQLFDEDDPVLRFYEGTGQLYIFLDGKKSNKWVDLVTRDVHKGVMTDEQKRVHLNLKSKSVFERISKSEKVSFRDAQGYQKIVCSDTVIGTVVTDSLNHISRMDIDYLFPDTVRVINLVLMKLRVTEAKEHYIYQQASDGYVSQSTLLGYQSFMRCWTKMFGMTIEDNSFDEFYVEKAECLTEEQYKEAVKEEKARKKNTSEAPTSEQLDQYIADHNIPAIPEEILRVLELSKQVQADKAAKKNKKKKAQ